MFKTSAFLLLLLPLAFAGDSDTKPVLEFYDVKDLRADIASWKSVGTALVGLGADVRGHRGGVLVVRASPGVHRRIAALLAEVRRGEARQVTLDARLVVFPSGVKVPTALSRAEALQWVAKGKVDTLPAPKGAPGRWIDVHKMGSVAYIADFDVEVAQGQFIAGPVIDTIPSGIALRVMPELEGGSLVLSIDARVAHVKPSKKDSIRVGPREIRATRVFTRRAVVADKVTLVDMGRDHAGRHHVLLVGAKLKLR